MKIKISSLTKWMLMLMFIAGSSLLKPLGEGMFIWSTDMGVKKLCLYISTLCYLICLWKFRHSNTFLSLCVGLMIVTAIIAVARSEQKTSTAMVSAYNYFYILAAVPVYSLLVNGRWKLRNLLRNVTIITFLSFLLKSVITIVESFTGTVIFQTIALESVAKYSFRNGFLRINPPAFGIIIIPIAMYLYYSEENISRKRFYWAVAIMSVLYSGLVHQARSLLVYQVLQFAFIILIKNKHSKKFYIYFMVILALALMFINSSVGVSYISTFAEDGKYGNSTTSRLYAVVYFVSKWWSTSPLLGMGYINSSEYTLMGEYTTMGSLWDVGILTTITQMGLGALTVYVAFVVYGLVMGKKIASIDNNLKVLAYGLVAAVVLTEINIDWFMDIYAVSAPVGFAVIAYIGYLCGRVGKSSVEEIEI